MSGSAPRAQRMVGGQGSIGCVGCPAVADGDQGQAVFSEVVVQAAGSGIGGEVNEVAVGATCSRLSGRRADCDPYHAAVGVAARRGVGHGEAGCAREGSGGDGEQAGVSGAGHAEPGGVYPCGIAAGDRVAAVCGESRSVNHDAGARQQRNGCRVGECYVGRLSLAGDRVVAAGCGIADEGHA